MLSGKIDFDENNMKCNNDKNATFVNQLHIFMIYFVQSILKISKPICKFFIGEIDHTMKMDCSNSSLRDVGDLPNITIDMMNEHRALRCESDIQNNHIEQLPNLKLPQFECVQAIIAPKNSITSNGIQTENLGNNLSKSTTTKSVVPNKNIINF